MSTIVREGDSTTICASIMNAITRPVPVLFLVDNNTTSGNSYQVLSAVQFS